MQTRTTSNNIADHGHDGTAGEEMAHAQLALYARDLKRVVDQERQRSRELAEANERLKILDRLKTDFLAFISHELRTPLSAISAVDILGEQSDPMGQAELIPIIQHGYERLQAFIEKGLEYFDWLATGRVDSTERLDFRRLVLEVVEHETERKDGEFDFQVLAPGPCHLRGDPASLRPAVEILVDNAVKFSGEKKHVTVELSETPEAVTLGVIDQGVGFLPELAKELFRPFTIADARHHSKGSGLNLALASAIVTAHGGRISAASRGPGRGAMFCIELPATCDDPTSEVEIRGEKEGM